MESITLLLILLLSYPFLFVVSSSFQLFRLKVEGLFLIPLFFTHSVYFDLTDAVVFHVIMNYNTFQFILCLLLPFSLGSRFHFYQSLTLSILLHLWKVMLYYGTHCITPLLKQLQCLITVFKIKSKLILRSSLICFYFLLTHFLLISFIYTI